MPHILAAAGKAGTITGEMLSGLTDIITENIGTAVTAAVPIMAIMLGVAIVPKVIKKFF